MMKRLPLITLCVASVIILVITLLGAAREGAADPKPSGKLSFRLGALASSPGVQSMSINEQAASLSLPAEGPASLMRDEQGFLLVYIRMTDLSEPSLQALRSSGAKITHLAPDHNIVTAFVNVSSLSDIAGIPGLLRVQEALTPQNSGSPAAVLPQAIVAVSTCPSGTSVSEGDIQMMAATARSTYGLTGSGVEVGVLSDSFNRFTGSPFITAADDIASGDLPGPANTCGYTTAVNVLAEGPVKTTDEGRAMLQIIHDLAPGALLSFATADTGLLSFADNIRSLRNTAGADIIVDDVYYYEEPFFQEGPVNVAISDVVQAGALYFTSAGNQNLIIGGNNISSYEAPAYRPTTCPAGLPGFAGPDCHDFDPSGGVNNGSGVTLENNCQIIVDFQWNEPWYGLSNDLDIYLLNDSNTVVASSTDDNFSTPFQSPFEIFSYANTSGSPQHYRIVINRYDGSSTPRLKYVFMQNGWGCITNVQYSTSSGGDVIGPSLVGHSATRDGFSVGAVPYNDSTSPEYYTSHGPATHYYAPVVGTSPAAPITPDVIQQPDFAATDGGCNTFFGGFSSGCYRFYGTSAAAPHAAAVTALLKQEANLRGASLSRADAKTILQSTAQSVTNGNTNSVGSGLVDALSASAPVIRVTGVDVTGYYSGIQNAYGSAALSGDIIKAVSTTLNENLLFSSGKSVTFKGGFASGFFTSQTGFTTVHSLIVGTGILTVEYLALH